MRRETASLARPIRDEAVIDGRWYKRDLYPRFHMHHLLRCDRNEERRETMGGRLTDSMTGLTELLRRDVADEYGTDVLRPLSIVVIDMTA